MSSGRRLPHTILVETDVVLVKKGTWGGVKALHAN